MGTPRAPEDLNTLTIRLKSDGSDDALKQRILRFGKGDRNEALKQTLGRGFELPEPRPIQVVPVDEVAAMFERRLAPLREEITALRRQLQGTPITAAAAPISDEKRPTVNGASEEV